MEHITLCHLIFKLFQTSSKLQFTRKDHYLTPWDSLLLAENYTVENPKKLKGEQTYLYPTVLLYVNVLDL